MDAFFQQLLGSLGGGGGEGGTPSIQFLDMAGNPIPLSALRGGMLGGRGGRGVGRGGVGGRGAQNNIGNTPAGQVFRGEIPPMLWIQQEQRASATAGPTPPTPTAANTTAANSNSSASAANTNTSTATAGTTPTAASGRGGGGDGSAAANTTTNTTNTTNAAPPPHLQPPFHADPSFTRPDPSSPTQAAAALQLRQQGNRSMTDGHLAVALEIYSHAIELNPTDELCYSNRALVYLKLAAAVAGGASPSSPLRNTSAAAAAANTTTATAASSSSSSSLSAADRANLATFSPELSNASPLTLYEKAASDATMCINLNPNFYKGHYRLGSALMGKAGILAMAAGSGTSTPAPPAAPATSTSNSQTPRPSTATATANAASSSSSSSPSSSPSPPMLVSQQFTQAIESFQRAIALAPSDTEKNDINILISKCESKRAIALRKEKEEAEAAEAAKKKKEKESADGSNTTKTSLSNNNDDENDNAKDDDDFDDDRSFASAQSHVASPTTQAQTVTSASTPVPSTNDSTSNNNNNNNSSSSRISAALESVLKKLNVETKPKVTYTAPNLSRSYLAQTSSSSSSATEKDTYSEVIALVAEVIKTRRPDLYRQICGGGGGSGSGVEGEGGSSGTESVVSQALLFANRFDHAGAVKKVIGLTDLEGIQQLADGVAKAQQKLRLASGGGVGIVGGTTASSASSAATFSEATTATPKNNNNNNNTVNISNNHSARVCSYHDALVERDELYQKLSEKVEKAVLAVEAISLLADDAKHMSRPKMNIPQLTASRSTPTTSSSSLPPFVAEAKKLPSSMAMGAGGAAATATAAIETFIINNANVNNTFNANVNNTFSSAVPAAAAAADASASSSAATGASAASSAPPQPPQQQRVVEHNTNTIITNTNTTTTTTTAAAVSSLPPVNPEDVLSKEEVATLLGQLEAAEGKITRQLTQAAKKTDAAARQFLECLRAEQKAMDELKPLVTGCERIKTQLKREYVDIKLNQLCQPVTTAVPTNPAAVETGGDAEKDDNNDATTTATPPPVIASCYHIPPPVTAQQLEALSSIVPRLKRIRSEVESFHISGRRGQELLELEARLEHERLRQEKHRIHLKADLEWLAVKEEEDYSSRAKLQEAMSTTQMRIHAIAEQQSAVHQELLKLISGDRPELQWSASAGGNKVLRWLKGSGLWVNRHFSDFQVIATLASTINSKVYLARAPRTGEEVTLKEVPVETEAKRRQFQNEINVMLSINQHHPNIVRVQGIFFDGPFAYIVMPFYNAGSFKTFLGTLAARQRAQHQQRLQQSQQNGDDTDDNASPSSSSSRALVSFNNTYNDLSTATFIPWHKYQELMRQVVSGIAFLHEKGIVHQDIKPSNILLSADGFVSMVGSGGGGAATSSSLITTTTNANNSANNGTVLLANSSTTTTSGQFLPAPLPIIDYSNLVPAITDFGIARDIGLLGEKDFTLTMVDNGDVFVSGNTHSSNNNSAKSSKGGKKAGSGDNKTMRREASRVIELDDDAEEEEGDHHNNNNGTASGDNTASSSATTTNTISGNTLYSPSARIAGTFDFMAPERQEGFLRGAAAFTNTNNSSSSAAASSSTRGGGGVGGGSSGPLLPPPSPSPPVSQHATMKADIWSLGMTMYSIAAANTLLASGAGAFGGGGESDADNSTAAGNNNSSGDDNNKDDSATNNNASNANGLIVLPFLGPNDACINVDPAMVGGNVRLAELLTSMLTRDPAKRPTVMEVMAHPYFTIPQVDDYVLNNALVQSNRKLEAFRNYTHALRAQHRQPTLVSVVRSQMVESVTNIFTQFKESEVLAPLFVVFRGEEGVDEGALTSEMFSLYFQQAVTKDKLFVMSNGNGGDDNGENSGSGDSGGGGGSSSGASAAVTSGNNNPLAGISPNAEYVPSSDPRIPIDRFVVLGRVLLKCLLENRNVPFKISPVVFKFITAGNNNASGASSLTSGNNDATATNSSSGAASTSAASSSSASSSAAYPRLTLADLEGYDRSLAQNLKRLLILGEEELLDMSLDFSDISSKFLSNWVARNVSTRVSALLPSAVASGAILLPPPPSSSSEATTEGTPAAASSSSAATTNTSLVPTASPQQDDSNTNSSGPLPPLPLSPLRFTRDTLVTIETVRYYIQIRLEYELIGKREEQLNAIRRGFFTSKELDPHLRLFSPAELQIELTGHQHISPQVVVNALQFVDFPSSSNTPAHLKEIILGFSQNNLRRFLMLCTPHVVVPAGGLPAIRIQRTADLSRLPVGHGCVSQLDLPDYNNKETLRNKLALALAHVNDGFFVA